MDKKLIGKGLAAFRTKGFSGFNLDRNIFIKCVVCGDFVSMHPRMREECSCGNIIKDIDMGIIECRSGLDDIEVYRTKLSFFKGSL